MLTKGTAWIAVYRGSAPSDVLNPGESLARIISAPKKGTWRQTQKELCGQRGPAGLPWERLLIGKGFYWGAKDRRRHPESCLPHPFPPSAWDQLQGRQPQACPGFWRAGEGIGIDIEFHVCWSLVSIPRQTVATKQANGWRRKYGAYTQWRFTESPRGTG
ncbi:uncharacterized protein LOC328577 isoform X1 [Mus musculus]|uniref:RIKEN cDNA 7530416G11 gene n=1 Tax=Mus musculus TaxID=10090 RepID=J3QJX6_MOUSE|nr:uncharacterized protein LOC328577 [Mus musculus]XP_017172158.1 uncharacterized protein LOC328577 isoform X1 [Mus musculus]|eukprot:NP_001243001.1 uncharacterized protein LOC328577 [Mus musculus]